MYENRFEILPAIDLINGECVRLYQGDYNQQTTYDSDPVSVAKRWEAEGGDRVHVVDLDGAKAGKPINLEIIHEIAQAVKIPIEVGGGIRSLNNVKQLLDGGVDRIILGSIAVKQPELVEDIISQVDTERVVIGIDIMDGKPAIHGWLDTVDQDLIPFLKSFESMGIKHLIVTDISKDGAMLGPNIELMQKLTRQVDIPIIASGGVTKISDVINLRDIEGVEGCIIGKTLYEGKMNLEDLRTI